MAADIWVIAVEVSSMEDDRSVIVRATSSMDAAVSITAEEVCSDVEFRSSTVPAISLRA
jgi:hypothetical protein